MATVAINSNDSGGQQAIRFKEAKDIAINIEHKYGICMQDPWRPEH
jgi:hypothetical protein